MYDASKSSFQRGDNSGLEEILQAALSHDEASGLSE
jgi:hypothetical protein